ncbi:MAG: 2-oxoacid:ferredoxin oxidoreductase subunit beta, partial [Planctomycetota bacterium]
FNPISLALGAGATFVARTMDTHPKHMEQVLLAAAQHKGSAFIEIYQNCVIFNDGAFEEVAGRKVRDERTIDLHPGEPMVYGKDHDKGLRFEGFDVVPCGADEAQAWDPTRTTVAPAQLLAELDRDPTRPNAVGIFRQVDAPLFDRELNDQVDRVTEKKGKGVLRDLVYTPDSWIVD